MPETSQTSTNLSLKGIPYKEDIYWTYVQWKALPAQLKGTDPKKLTELGFDDEALSLMKIKDQTDFANHFDVSRESLSHWKKLERFPSDVSAQIKQSVLHTYEAAIAHKFTLKTLEKADAQRVELWMKLYGGYVEKEQIDATIVTAETVTLPDLADRENIMSIVLGKVAAKKGKDINRLTAQVTQGFYKSTNGVEDVEHTEIYPSDQQYDFDEIEKKHKGAKVEAEAPTPSNGNPDPDLKQRLLEKLSATKDEMSEKDKIKAALKKQEPKRRVKKKGDSKKKK